MEINENGTFRDAYTGQGSRTQSRDQMTTGTVAVPGREGLRGGDTAQGRVGDTFISYALFCETLTQ